MKKEGKYIYCIAQAKDKRSFGSVGMGGRDDEVYILAYQDLSAIISDSPVTQYAISRENTLTHQRVMEEVMKYYPILPVKFGTVAKTKDGLSPEENIREKVLKGRYQELAALLEQIDGKVELGVKVLWTDMKVIFGEIVEENPEIRRLRNHIAKRRGSQARDRKIQLGEMVRSALENKRIRERKTILGALKKLSVDHRINRVFGDQMVLNAAFLVEADRKEKEFDAAVNELSIRDQGRTKFKYVGPTPPCNFVEITISWE